MQRHNAAILGNRIPALHVALTDRVILFQNSLSLLNVHCVKILKYIYIHTKLAFEPHGVPTREEQKELTLLRQICLQYYKRPPPHFGPFLVELNGGRRRRKKSSIYMVYALLPLQKCDFIFCTFCKGKMPKIGLKINKIEIWPKSGLKVIIS